MDVELVVDEEVEEEDVDEMVLDTADDVLIDELVDEAVLMVDEEEVEAAELEDDEVGKTP